MKPIELGETCVSSFIHSITSRFVRLFRLMFHRKCTVFQWFASETWIGKLLFLGICVAGIVIHSQKCHKCDSRLSLNRPVLIIKPTRNYHNGACYLYGLCPLSGYTFLFFKPFSESFQIKWAQTLDKGLFILYLCSRYWSNHCMVPFLLWVGCFWPQ